LLRRSVQYDGSFSLLRCVGYTQVAVEVSAPFRTVVNLLHLASDVLK
jgi:hypothetical protein